MVDSYLPQVEAIREYGITIIEKDGTKRAFTTVKAAASGEVKEHMDLIHAIEGGYAYQEEK